MPLLEILISDKRWRKIPKLSANLEKAAQVTHSNLPKSLRFTIAANVLLTSDQEVKKLNQHFRGINKPTNVLSFPQYQPDELTKIGKRQPPKELGDIVLGYQYMVAECKKDHKLLINHSIHLLIHGLLHLFGYDHTSNKEALLMEGLETKIMAKLDLPNPYMNNPVKQGKRKLPKTQTRQTLKKRTKK